MASLPFGKLPASRRLSWLALSLDRAGDCLIRDVHGGDYTAPYLFKLRFAGHDAPEDLVWSLTPSELSARSRKDPAASFGAVFGDCDDLYLRCEGFRLTLEALPKRYDSLVRVGAAEWEYQLYSANRKVLLRGSSGSCVEFCSSWHVSESRDIAVVLDGGIGRAELSLASYRVTPPARFSNYDAEKTAAAADFEAWDGSFPAGEDDRFADTARYVLWGNFVHRDGVLSRDALYMNKLSMTNIWSWDNCFSALSLARTLPEVALDQLLVILDRQDESGALPDYVNDLFASYSCVKPPVYGWTLERLREANPFFHRRDVLSLLYGRISGLTAFWLERRFSDEHQLCYYLHGNDSGWDNASVFHRGCPVVSGDLAAWLVCQMDTLSNIACELGRPDEAAWWTKKADAMYAALRAFLWTPEGFVTRSLSDGSFDAAAQSLLNLLPLIVHYRMDADTKSVLVKRLADFEGRFGLATEKPGSPYYKKGGYWLGPVWAPVTVIFVDALHRAGRLDMAARLAAKFRELPTTGLAAENFDAQTGEGFDDNAFAWTAAAYFLLERYEH